jgi:hypothetical protein
VGSWDVSGRKVKGCWNDRMGTNKGKEVACGITKRKEYVRCMLQVGRQSTALKRLYHLRHLSGHIPSRDSQLYEAGVRITRTYIELSSSR